MEKAEILNELEDLYSKLRKVREQNEELHNLKDLRIILLEQWLGVILDQVDYTSGACRQTEMVGAILDKSTIEAAKSVLGGQVNKERERHSFPEGHEEDPRDHDPLSDIGHLGNPQDYGDR